LPRWVAVMDSERLADRYFHKKWDHALPDSVYARCEPDTASYKTGPDTYLSNTLPQIIGEKDTTIGSHFYIALGSSPFGNDLVLTAARRAVINENLGMDTIPDLLVTSLTSPDRAGHNFGAESPEMLDMMARTDHQLAEWLAFLDQNIGLENCLLALTGDHGVTPVPEVAAKQGLPHGRYDWKELERFLQTGMNRRLKTDSLRWLPAMDLPWLFLDDSLLTAYHINEKAAAETLAACARDFPAVETAFASPNLAARPANVDSQLFAAATQNVFPGRSGQVYVHLKANWALKGDCTGHGTAHDCDVHVPLFLMGKPFQPGSYSQPVGIEDLAVTLCTVLGIQAPKQATGHSLSYIFKTDK
jgi:hypothetical protein